MRTRPKYREGELYAVPLRDHGFATVLVARACGGLVLGYFFGPRFDRLEDAPSQVRYSPADAVLVGLFGDLHLIQGKWPLIGAFDEWSRQQWPIPTFLRRDAVNPVSAVCVEYGEDLEEINSSPCDPVKHAELPQDGLMGAGFVELRLTELLSSPG